MPPHCNAQVLGATKNIPVHLAVRHSCRHCTEETGRQSFTRLEKYAGFIVLLAAFDEMALLLLRCLETP
jgi:hypothetical protein